MAVTQTELDRLREHVRGLLERGQPDAAIEALGAAVRAHPRDVDLRLLAATAHEQRGAATEAADHYAGVLAIDPDHDDANRRLGALLGQLGDSGGAVRCWRRVVQRNPDDLDVLTTLGIALSTDGQHAEAIQILWEVAGRRSELSAAHANLGMALLAARRLDEAVIALGRALELDRASPQAYCGLGMVFQQQGRWREAADAFRSTERLAPENPVGPMNLGLALQALGEHDEARRALERAARLAPHDREIARLLEAYAAVERTGSVVDDLPDEPTRPALQVDQADAAIAGDLKSFPLPDLLEFLRLQRKSGSLVVASSYGAGQVRIVQGRATSASAPSIKRLGEALAERRIITAEALERALAAQRDDRDESLAAVLLEGALIDEAKLSEALNRQVVAALDQMMSWREGTFSFHDAEPKGAAPVSFDLQQLMMTVMKLRDERMGAVPARPVT